MSKKLFEILRTLTFIPLSILIGYIFSLFIHSVGVGVQTIAGLDANNFVLKGVVTLIAWNSIFLSSSFLKPKSLSEKNLYKIWAVIIGLYSPYVISTIRHVNNYPNIYWWHPVIEGLGPLIVGYLMLKDGKIIWQKDNE